MKTKIKEQLVKSIQNEIESRQKLIQALDRVPVNLISEAFPNGSWSPSWGSRFDFTLPFDFRLIEQVKAFMVDQFPEYELKYENRFVWDASKEAGHFLEYHTNDEHWQDRAEFQFCFRTGREGTTCVLNKIGEKSIPVFEVICAAGAEEMAAK